MSQPARITSEPLAFLCVLRIYYITVNSLPLATQETFSTPRTKKTELSEIRQGTNITNIQEAENEAPVTKTLRV